MRFSTVKLAAVTLALIVCTTVMNMRASTAADANTQEGCLNQWLFNGVWRVQVTAVEPYMNGNQQTGWQVTEVWRNGTSRQLYPSQSQLDDQKLELTNGFVTAKGSTGGTMSMGSVANNAFAPAGQYTYKQIFLVDNLDPSNKPKAVDILFDAKLLAQFKGNPQFTTSHYDYRFKLDCVASGAAAQAQGGSTQIAATDGCMNQWMSNGIWKMRVTALALNEGKYGWLATQTWVNDTTRGIVTGGSPDKGQAFLPTHVTDEYLVTQSGNNASSANAVGGFQVGSKPGYDWPAGSSYTFSQLFIWSPFDANDKPARLLVTFDDKTQKATPGLPQYKKPANFRIDLTCSK